jgi:DNA-binding Xre family transcriptional regulator
MVMDVAAIIEKAGGPVELARRLGVARTTVLDWRKARRIPGSRLAQIAIELDIPAQDLVPIAQPPRGQAA